MFCAEYLLMVDKVKYIPISLYNYYDKLTAFEALNIIDSRLKNAYNEKFRELTNYCRTVWTLDCFRILCFDKLDYKRRAYFYE